MNDTDGSSENGGGDGGGGSIIASMGSMLITSADEFTPQQVRAQGFARSFSVEELTAKKEETMRKVNIETTSISKFRGKVAVRPPQFEDDGGPWSVILPLLKSVSHTEWAAISAYLTSRKYLREHIEKRDKLEVERQDWIMALEMREISDSAAVSTRPRLVRNDSLM